MVEPETPVGEVGERALLRHLRGRIPSGDGVTLGIGDDAAAVATGALTLVTADSLVEGVHFLRDWTPPSLLGRKALAVNLSDIAAMGGVPRYATVSLCLPRSLPMGFLDGLYDGLLERAAQTGVTVVGGNLSSIEGPLVIDVTLLGRGDRLLTRAGARAGDAVVVTGALGAAAEGLRLLRQGARLDEERRVLSLGMWTESSQAAVAHCLRAQLDPEPPLAFARCLAELDFVHAAMDLSDGLSADLLSICEESGLQARLERAALPADACMVGLERARGGDGLKLVLHGGEDYQLLLALPRESLCALLDQAVVWNLPLTAIGEFVAGEPGVWISDGGEWMPVETAGHDHFRAAAAAGGAGR